MPRRNPGAASTTPRRPSVSGMNHLCCPTCRLRFAAEAAIYLVACPDCERPAQWVAEPERVMGYQLFDPRDLTDLVTPDESRH